MLQPLDRCNLHQCQHLSLARVLTRLAPLARLRIARQLEQSQQISCHVYFGVVMWTALCQSQSMVSLIRKFNDTRFDTHPSPTPSTDISLSIDLSRNTSVPNRPSSQICRLDDGTHLPFESGAHSQHCVLKLDRDQEGHQDGHLQVHSRDS